MKSIKIALITFIGLVSMLNFSVVTAQPIYDDIVFQEPVIFDSNIEFWAELDDEGNVYMDWNRYNHSENFDFYKIVRSENKSNPVYPQDGYIYFTDDIDILDYTDTQVPFGDSYYRICEVAGPKRYCSEEVVVITKMKPLLINKDIKLEEASIANLVELKPDLRKDIDLIDKPELVAPEGEILLPDPDRDLNAENDKPAKENVAEQMEPKDTSIEALFSEYWVQFLALIVSLIGVALAVTGFTVAGAKRKKSVSKFLHEIDDTFASFKWKKKRCEAELYRIQDVIEDKLKAGKIDEATYDLLIKRIDRYLSEIQDIDNLPGHLKE